MSTELAVVSERLQVVRGGRKALDDLSATILAGTVTGLLGPSGSGKSTLMRAIVGVQVIRSGSLRVFGLQAGSPALRPRIGYMTQAPSVYGDLTVAENLRYFARVLRASAKRVDEVIDAVGLEAERDRVVDRLSGGQRARVSLAAALVGEPELLVLDEPTVGLDPVLRRDLWAMFTELAGQGTTLLVSSHVMDEARHCDELLLLHEGRLLATGSPDELRRRTGADDLDDGFLRLVEGARR
ncbi:MAG TPA: ABC transporter ATP-binding protein [Gaiellaceae bacterium]|nr:ABC transporter ATP-binding protein [Gaiellaceae bacterium]